MTEFSLRNPCKMKKWFVFEAEESMLFPGQRDCKHFCGNSKSDNSGKKQI